MPAAVGYAWGRRPTYVGGDVAALGHGFNLGAIIRGGIGLLTGIVTKKPTMPPPGGGGPMFFPPPALPPGPTTALAMGATVTQIVGKRLLNAGVPLTVVQGLVGNPIGAAVAALTSAGFGQFVSLLTGRGGAGGRRRRMNPLNLRALGRADRRLTSFAKIARRYVRRDAPQRVVRTRALARRR